MANDAVGSIRTVASFCAENKVMDLYQKKCEVPEKHGMRLGLVSGTGYGFSFLALFCANAFCFYIGAVLVKHGQATFGEVFKVRTSNNFPTLFSATSLSHWSYDSVEYSLSFAGFFRSDNFSNRAFTVQCNGP